MNSRLRRGSVAVAATAVSLIAAELAIRWMDGWPLWGRLPLAEHAVDEATARTDRPDRRYVQQIRLPTASRPNGTRTRTLADDGPHSDAGCGGVARASAADVSTSQPARCRRPSGRLFRAYADKRVAGYVEVAASVPQYADLFGDPIHMGESGHRLQTSSVLRRAARARFASCDQR